MKLKWINRTALATGVLLWSGLAGLRLLDAWQNARLIPALLAAQSGLVAWLLVVRNRQATETAWLHKTVAWVSALLPLSIPIDHEILAGQIVNCSGLLLVLWSLFTLGPSFGIAPGDRGLVVGGPYRIIRHPMYLGELIALIGAVSGDPSPWNFALLSILLFALLLRISWEEQSVTNYGAYASQVRWRLIPFIF